MWTREDWQAKATEHGVVLGLLWGVGVMGDWPWWIWSLIGLATAAWLGFMYSWFQWLRVVRRAERED